MVDFNIATGAEQPLNRTGVANCQVDGADVQGTLVGVMDPDGDGNYGLYKADADATYDADGDAAQDGPLPALGVLLPEEIVDTASLPTGAYLHDLEEQLVQENKTLKGDRAVFIKYGVEMVNNDNDTNFTPGEPVYLGKGGGFTQDLSTFAPGDIVQKVGIALDPNEDAGVGTEQGDRILLAVEDSYEVFSQGEAVFSGDATGGVTTFNIAHGLDSAPSVVHVTPTSADAAGDFHVTVDATNITLNYASAPADGTDNVTVMWQAEE